MSENEELLMSAAKAAGINLFSADAGRVFAATAFLFYEEKNGSKTLREWRPLSDDGDALRLSIDLDISLRQHLGMVLADFPFIDGINERKTIFEAAVGDHHAETRMVIVRAAAEIGKAMGGEAIK